MIFTDLDGTLLDSETYSFAAAREALLELRRRRVPLVLCSSKTRAEVTPLRRRLKNAHPFIVENGGAIVIPESYFGRGKPRRIELARPYSEVAPALEGLARSSRVRVKGFHRMTARQIAEGTGLSLAEAHLAKRREFDEPFLFLGADEKTRARFTHLAKKSGFALTRGGRFWHLSSGSDKGLAVRRLLALYRLRSPRRPLRSLALGDAANDLPMLRAAHRAVLLPRPDGSFDRAVLQALPKVIRGSAPGPEGWNDAVLSALNQRDR